MSHHTNNIHGNNRNIMFVSGYFSLQQYCLYLFFHIIQLREIPLGSIFFIAFWFNISQTYMFFIYLCTIYIFIKINRSHFEPWGLYIYIDCPADIINKQKFEITNVNEQHSSERTDTLLHKYLILLNFLRFYFHIENFEIVTGRYLKTVFK